MKPLRPSLAVIIPVLHEETGINGLVAALRTQEGGDEVEIIVVDGDPQGGTVGVVDDAGVRTLISVPGRGRQMNRGAAVAASDILIFLHADTRLPSRAFCLIREALRDGRVVSGAFDLGFDTGNKLYRAAEKYVYCRTRLTKVPFGDQGIFVRRRYFEEIGGYRDIPLMEDVDLMRRIKRRRDAIVVIPEKVRTSPRRYEREGVLFGTIRNVMLQLLFLLGVAPERLAKWYR